MVSAASGSVPLPSAWTKAWEFLLAHRLMIYISVLLVASLAAYGYGIRSRTIFACQADGYSADRYLAYCNGANYADYEHGAFQFKLEPSVQDAVKNADVLFLGNSRVQVAFSTAPTEQWFSANSARYYLLGFSYYENVLFEGALLNRIHPHASVYVINVNDFFVPTESVPVKTILHDAKAPDEYEAKRFWQSVHEQICGTLTMICGRKFVIFRSRDTGAYYTEGALSPKVVPVSYRPSRRSERGQGQYRCGSRFFTPNYPKEMCNTDTYPLCWHRHRDREGYRERSWFEAGGPGEHRRASDI